LFFSLIPLYAPAQLNIKICVEKYPLSGLSEHIYIAGSFNEWNPGDPAYQLHKTAEGYCIQLPPLQAGRYEFKFTAGSWDHSEVNAQFQDIPNRLLLVERDSVYSFQIHEWHQASSRLSTRSTRSTHVFIADSAFYLPALGRKRRVWIYLPEGYETSKNYYPVLYMQDGQNLFDESTSFSGEWRVDEILDSMHAECIVVGIDHGGDRRVNEYNIHDMEKYGKGEGREYLKSVVTTLKPFIDRKFRTLRARQSTFIAGSSMGALISFYAMLYYPEVFSGAGIFSPAFWIAPATTDAARFIGKRNPISQKYFFYAGAAESEHMLPDVIQIFNIMHKNKNSSMKLVIRGEGMHNEHQWQQEFPAFYQWMIGAVQ